MAGYSWLKNTFSISLDVKTRREKMVNKGGNGGRVEEKLSF